jgi:hypothetical protein
MASSAKQHECPGTVKEEVRIVWTEPYPANDWSGGWWMEFHDGGGHLITFCPWCGILPLLALADTPSTS